MLIDNFLFHIKIIFFIFSNEKIDSFKVTVEMFNPISSIDYGLYLPNIV